MFEKTKEGLANVEKAKYVLLGTVTAVLKSGINELQGMLIIQQATESLAKRLDLAPEQVAALAAELNDMSKLEPTLMSLFTEEFLA